MNKLMSGRWLLTVSAAIVFTIMSVNGSLSQEAVSTLLATVFTLYFTKQRKEEK